MKRSLVLIFSVMLLLAGCGSSSSSGPTKTTGTVYSTAPNTVSLLAGTVGSSGSTNSPAKFGQPNGVAVSPDGTTLYVADIVNHTIRQVVVATGAVTTIAGVSGSNGFVDGALGTAKFNAPHSLVVDATGTNLYVVDVNNNAIRKVVIATGAVSTLVGSSAGLSAPIGITISGTTLYVTDFNNNLIRTVQTGTGAVSTLSTNQALSNPTGIVVDASGNLYVTEINNRTILKIDTSGVVTTLAGSVSFYGTADGNGAAASFLSPNGITLQNGNLYVSDTNNHLIRKIVIATGDVTTVAGTPGVSGSTNGTGAAASFLAPIGIAASATSLFVADAGNFTIRQIQ